MIFPETQQTAFSQPKLQSNRSLLKPAASLRPFSSNKFRGFKMVVSSRNSSYSLISVTQHNPAPTLLFQPLPPPSPKPYHLSNVLVAGCQVLGSKCT